MKKLTKKQFEQFAKERGCIASYSGKLKRFFLTKLVKMDINKIINSKNSL